MTAETIAWQADRDRPRMIAETDHVAPAPRRVRATLGGETIFDTTRARLASAVAQRARYRRPVYGQARETVPGTRGGPARYIATAIAGARARAELAACRARIAATADETRRRIERDLHDGAQQRLVSLALQLRAAQETVPPELGRLRVELGRVAAGLADTLEELREYARGIHPATLAEGGLAPALKTLARRSPVPVTLQVQLAGRLPERVEVTAYYVVSEALANAAKHAGASAVHVTVGAAGDVLRLAVRDDGVGSADPARGSGLAGLNDRVAAIGGTLRMRSRPGEGTTLRAELPARPAQPPPVNRLEGRPSSSPGQGRLTAVTAAVR